jgi:hypothetical protein
MNHWAWRRAQQVQVFPICVWPRTNSGVTRYVLLYCTYGLAARVQTCPSFVINARLSPSDSDSESMVLKRDAD